MKTRRKRTLPALAVLLGLLAAGGLLFASQHERVENLLYPRKYQRYVEYYAEEYGLDPLLVYAFIRTESNFVPDAASDAGARGLMQITSDTFDWIKGNIAADEPLTFDDLFDPECNIRFGAYFVKACLVRYRDDLPTAAAAYHSGWGTVDALLADAGCASADGTLIAFPYEQMNLYVKKITDAYAEYQRLYRENQQ